ncbi:hypothetical protein BHE74_00037068 [Ensete ventricosum]|nr:hypothetical protein BHE74_00037068 [Ensete ventricosum]
MKSVIGDGGTATYGLPRWLVAVGCLRQGAWGLPGKDPVSFAGGGLRSQYVTTEAKREWCVGVGVGGSPR